MMGFEPDDCAVIEDSALGVRAGISAGMKVFGFAPQERRVQLEPSRKGLGFKNLLRPFGFSITK